MYDLIIKAIQNEITFCTQNKEEVIHQEDWSYGEYTGYMAGLRQSLFIIAKEIVLDEQTNDEHPEE